MAENRSLRPVAGYEITYNKRHEHIRQELGVTYINTITELYRKFEINACWCVNNAIKMRLKDVCNSFNTCNRNRQRT